MKMKSIAQKQKIFFAMGTVCSITIYSDNDTVLNLIKEKILTLDDKLSAYKEDSEITRINKNAGLSPVSISDETYMLIKSSIMFSKLTDGYFDITATPLANAYKKAIKTNTFPDDIDITNNKKLINYKDIKLFEDTKSVMLKNKGQSIDLGAIAKGYATEIIYKILVDNNIQNALINFGGTIKNIGPTKSVGIQKPFSKNGISFAKINIPDKTAVVSSGIYEQYKKINDTMIHHIVDPKTLKPSNSDLIGITLVGNDAITLDALATALFITGTNDALKILKERDIEAIFITKNGTIYTTEKINKNIEMIEDKYD